MSGDAFMKHLKEFHPRIAKCRLYNFDVYIHIERTDEEGYVI